MGKRSKQTRKPVQEKRMADSFVDDRDAELYEDEIGLDDVDQCTIFLDDVVRKSERVIGVFSSC